MGCFSLLDGDRVLYEAPKLASFSVSARIRVLVPVLVVEDRIFVPSSYASASFAFSDKSPLRHLSERLRFVTKTLLEWTGSLDETPADFSRVIPST